MGDSQEQLPSILLRYAVDKLSARETESAQRDAEIMLAYVLGTEPPRIPLLSDTVALDKEAAFDAMIARRLTGEPVAYIIEQQSFWTLDLTVTPGVLIPRPDTETLVEAGLNALSSKQEPRILDIGTGTGCVLLSLLSEVSSASGVGIDVSPKAIETARENAVANKLDDKAVFIQGDMFTPVLNHTLSGFDLIVSNPPYIPTKDIAELMADVRDYEPSLALDGGDDGLDFYRRLADESAQFMNDGATIAVEVGFDQAIAVFALFEAAGFKDILIKQDLNGINRVVSAKK